MLHPPFSHSAAPSSILYPPSSPSPAPSPQDRSILFAPPLVRAILDGRKTITRRLVAPQLRTPPPPEHCPFGLPGDRLCVREKWGYHEQFFRRQPDAEGPFVYAADGPPAGARFALWKPSLLMPRAACRLLLDITAVRSERLTQISPAEALAEGCPPDHVDDPIAWFRRTWDRFNPRSPWRTDPWVWVIDFRIAGTGATP